jgi:glycosyltransferase involved in cell wall biosynthesis
VSSRKIKDPVEQSGCGIIVEPENPEAIVEGINTLYNMSNEERETMGEKGYNYVKKYHNFDYLSDKYIALFKE